MKPIDYRNETFEAVKRRGLVRLRLKIYEAFWNHGAMTTREIARVTGIDILTARPRVTELYQLGFLALVGVTNHQGLYVPLNEQEARTKFEKEKRAAHQPELQLK